MQTEIRASTSLQQLSPDIFTTRQKFRSSTPTSLDTEALGNRAPMTGKSILSLKIFSNMEEQLLYLVGAKIGAQ
jgi:hypothetical protein